ncbi:MAG: isoleucine--tRNA ligase [Deltaproteobacteria bacterium]|nr:isoleucine--tRNA ligase [Deltaproteobacteria bacterium]
MEYKETLSLPRTDFSMKANLVSLEPKILSEWYQIDLYHKMREKRKGRKKFVLHDGPPYANGHVHLGTALNKILKDFIVKSRFMMNFDTPFVPGWDCHGMPIEHNVIKKLQGKKMDGLSIREECRKYAGEFLNIQREEFKRLGCIGDWDKPYITMSYDYEAKTMEALFDLFKDGYLYRGLRPIHWCAECKTALADAEVEYHNHSSPSIYVRFSVGDNDKRLSELNLRFEKPVHFLIWTTTPWTLPANLAVALHPDEEYVFFEAKDEILVFMKVLANHVIKSTGISGKTIKEIKGRELEGTILRHPMYNRNSIVILADFVTTDTGTGMVHIAPGHGAEDYEIGKKYRLDIYTPVDEEGRFTEDIPKYAGMKVHQANDHIIEELKHNGTLIKDEYVEHSYPHCWRCKNPIIFRATEQWFLSIDHANLRTRLLNEIDGVKWIPPWGRDRIYNMVQIRPDWCLSRQRYWGVPIPAIRCSKCSHTFLNESIFKKAIELTYKEGSDCWFKRDINDFVPEGLKCPNCDEANFIKEENILDVWFDSSVSQRAVLEGNNDLSYPCDLYLEATDQHRGWFQVSLITSVANRNMAPYRAVLTHGLILDKDAKKMSKSLGNVIAPEEVISTYGADILRLLFSSVDYTSDIIFTTDMLGLLSENYRKIRNTIRFALGNLFDFNPDTDMMATDRLLELDRIALNRFYYKAEKIFNAYKNYEFYTVYHTAIEMCATDLSAIYFDIIKDRLYTSKKDGLERRSAQSVLFIIAKELIKLLAPIISYTAEDAYKFIPKYKGKEISVFLENFDYENYKYDDDALHKWDSLLRLRDEILKGLEEIRRQKIIGQSLEASIYLNIPDKYVEEFNKITDKIDLKEFFICSEVGLNMHIEDVALSRPLDMFNGGSYSLKKAPGKKCPRCWRYSVEFVENTCPKCYQALR